MVGNARRGKGNPNLGLHQTIFNRAIQRGVGWCKAMSWQPFYPVHVPGSRRSETKTGKGHTWPRHSAIRPNMGPGHTILSTSLSKASTPRLEQQDPCSGFHLVFSNLGSTCCVSWDYSERPPSVQVERVVSLAADSGLSHGNADLRLT